MRKLAAVVALIGAVALAAVATALEINSLRGPGSIPAATAGVSRLAVVASSPGSLPSGLIAFTGTGDEFWVEFWNDDDGNGTWSFGTPMGIPGSFTLPRPNVERSGDSLFVKARFYCATDSVTYIWTDR